MSKPCLLLALALLSSCMLPGCANPHFFPRLRPLFAGLNEENMTISARESLSKAKTDFILAKHGKAPQHAKFSHAIPHTRSKVYEGDGYRLTMVREDNMYPHRVGPDIVVSASLTGGRTYHYDEVDEVAE